MPEIHGHRGARALRPENTLSGLACALAIGVDAIEFDVTLTTDGGLILAHDLVASAETILDTAPATSDALLHVVDAAGDLCEIYVDGGIRRGSDVLKAIALGARAVLVGRAVLWGLCVEGESGARNVLEILRRELDEAMLLCGCAKLSDLGRWLLAP